MCVSVPDVVYVHFVHPLKATIIEKGAEPSVLQRALDHKMESSLAMEEENRRLRDNQMDQKKIKLQRQMLKQGQAEVQKMLQEVKEEKVKLKVNVSVYILCVKDVLYLYHATHFFSLSHPRTCNCLGQHF